MELISQKKEEYGSEYDKHLFEQYKLYLEMADRISARRMLANSFFLTINTGIIATLSGFLKDNVMKNNLLSIITLLAFILFCYCWYKIVISYKQLNSGKFRVIHEIEKLLPIKLYDFEWFLLGQGQDKKKYTPLTHIENYVPVIFGILYFIFILTIIYPYIIKIFC